MRKIGIVFLILVCFISTVKAASLCSYEKQVELSKSAINVKMSFEEEEGVREPGTYYPPEGVDPETYEAKYDYFKLKIVNLDENVYVKLENSTNKDIKYIKYEDTNEGTFEIDWKDLTKVTTFTYTIYTSDKTYCPNEELKKGYLTVPMYNRYHLNDRCAEYPEHKFCQKYVTYDLSGELFYETLDSYILKENDKKNNEKKEESKSGIIGFVKNHKYTLGIGISILIVVGVAAGVLLAKKRRSKVI